MASDTNSSTTQITTNSPSKPIKRRSRSSKRTPTTLLTANPTNFRALVQQFTGCHPTKSNPYSSLIGSQKGPVNLDFQLGSVSNLQNNNQRIINYNEPAAFGNFSDHTNNYDQFQTVQQQTCDDVLSENLNVETRSSEIGLDGLDESMMMGDGVDLMDDIASLEHLNNDQGYFWNLESQYSSLSHNIPCNFY